MNYFEQYVARMTINGETTAEKLINENESMYNNLTESPSHEKIQLNGVDVDSIIVDDSKVKEFKKLVTNVPQKAGDIIVWKDETWILLIADNMSDLYYRGSIQKSVSSLKWLSHNTIAEEFFIMRKEFSALGIEDGRVVSTSDEIRYLAVSNNINTRSITKDQRFIFDNRAWKVTAIDSLYTDGLINLTLKEDEINVANDNLNERIANYYDNIHVYSLTLTEGSSIALFTGDEVQLHSEITDNGKKVVYPVAYISSDEQIATVSSQGMVKALSDGEVAITATLAIDSAVYDNVQITVSSVVTDNYTIMLSGSDEIQVSKSTVCTAKVLNNGVEDSSKTCGFELLDDTGQGQTSLAAITSSTLSTCTIKANTSYNVGYVNLMVTCVEDSSINFTKRIRIKGIFN